MPGIWVPLGADGVSRDGENINGGKLVRYHSAVYSPSERVPARTRKYPEKSGEIKIALLSCILARLAGLFRSFSGIHS